MNKVLKDLKRNVLIDPFNMTAREIFAQALMKCEDEKLQKLGEYINERLHHNYEIKYDKNIVQSVETCSGYIKVKDKKGHSKEDDCEGTCDTCVAAKKFCGVPDVLLGRGYNYSLYKGFVYSIGIPLTTTDFYAHKAIIKLLKSQPIVDVHLAVCHEGTRQSYDYFRPWHVKIDDDVINYLPKKARDWLGSEIMEEINKWSDTTLLNNIAGFIARRPSAAISYSIVNTMRRKAKLPEITKPVITPRPYYCNLPFVLKPENELTHYTQIKSKKA